jgi:hypothetical protein
MVTHEQSWFHGTGWNFKSLNNKGSNKKGNQDGDDDRFQIFFDKCFLSHSLLFPHKMVYLLKYRVHAA